MFLKLQMSSEMAFTLRDCGLLTGKFLPAHDQCASFKCLTSQRTPLLCFPHPVYAIYILKKLGERYILSRLCLILSFYQTVCPAGWFPWWGSAAPWWQSLTLWLSLTGQPKNHEFQYYHFVLHLFIRSHTRSERTCL